VDLKATVQRIIGATISGIELHREIEGRAIPGNSIPTLIGVLDITREDFTNFCVRLEKRWAPGPRQQPSRVDSDFFIGSHVLLCIPQFFRRFSYAVAVAEGAQ